MISIKCAKRTGDTMISNVTHLPDSCLSAFVFPQRKLLQSFPKPPCSRMMKSSRSHKKQRLQTSRGCRTLCCSCRLSVSSSSEEAESAGPEQFATISSLAHAMVQERLDQMIRERQEVRHSAEGTRRRGGDGGGKRFVVMVAMEKSSHDPWEDFRESMVEMITVNKIDEPKDLRRLLNYYISMNSDEHRGLILEVFHDVCTRLFLCYKCH